MFNIWNNFRKVAIVNADLSSIPESFPRKKEFEDRFASEMEEHKARVQEIVGRYLPDYKTGDDINQAVLELGAMPQRDFRNEIARARIRKDEVDKKFDFDLTRALNYHKHKVEREQNKPSDIDIAKARREYQRRRYSDPVEQQKRSIINALAYANNREQRLQQAKEKYQADPETQTRVKERAKQQIRDIRSTEQGKISHNLYVRENRRVNNTPLTEDCSCGCKGDKKQHLQTFREDLNNEWDRLEFTDDTQRTIKDCSCGKCGNRSDIHFKQWYVDRVTKGRTSSRVFRFFRRV